jgi:hypothetical protein
MRLILYYRSYYTRLELSFNAMMRLVDAFCLKTRAQPQLTNPPLCDGTATEFDNLTYRESQLCCVGNSGPHTVNPLAFASCKECNYSTNILGNGNSLQRTEICQSLVNGLDWPTGSASRHVMPRVPESLSMLGRILR